MDIEAKSYGPHFVPIVNLNHFEAAIQNLPLVERLALDEVYGLNIVLTEDERTTALDELKAMEETGAASYEALADTAVRKLQEIPVELEYISEEARRSNRELARKLVESMGLDH